MAKSILPPGTVKWAAIIIVLYMVLNWVGDYWDKIMAGGLNAIILVLGVLVLILGGGVVLGKLRIWK